MGEETQYKKLSSFASGVISSQNNQMDFPETALSNGENLELANGLKTRPGTSVCSDGSLPVGEVVFSKQVRFPTNEATYLVAQVNEFSEATPARFEHAAIWRTAVSKMVVFGGLTDLDYGETSFLSDMWEFDPVESTWVQISASGGPSARRGSAAMYDSENDKMYLFGGQEADLTFSNEFWCFDFVSNTWTLLPMAGEKPNGRAHAFLIYGYSYGTWYFTVFGGDDRWLGNGEAFLTNDFYRCNSDTWTWAYDDYSEGWGEAITDYPDRVTNCGYCFVDNVLYMHGGNDAVETQHKWNWKYERGADEWTKLTDWPTLVGPTSQGSAVVGDYLLSIWGNKDSVKVYDISQDSWSDSSFSIEGLAPRLWPSAILDDSGNVILFGGWKYDYSDPEYVENVTDETFIVTYNTDTGVCDTVNVDFTIQEGTATIIASKLYASPTVLPSSNIQFTEIYDLGAGAGTVNAAVLNDRVVFTEGVNNPPLVWSGCMAEDASDWAYPKQVLVTQDGDNFYDISSSVLDKDFDNYADVGSILASGCIAVCCDMPQAEAFHIEMNTPNSTSEATNHTYDLGTTFSDTSKFDRENYFYGIDRYEKTGTKIGLFEYAPIILTSVADAGSGNVSILLSEARNWTGLRVVKIEGTTNYNGEYLEVAGGDSTHLIITHAYTAESFTSNSKVRCEALSPHADADDFEPDVVAGLFVDGSTGDSAIKSLSDVTGLGKSVALYDDLATQTISGIYGLVNDDGRVRCNINQQRVLATGLDLSGTSLFPYSSAYRYMYCKNIIPGASISGDEITAFRVTLEASALLYAGYPSSGLNITRMTVMESATGNVGANGGGVAPIKQITFNGGASGVRVAAEGTAVSDIVTFTINPAKSYVFIFEVDGEDITTLNLNGLKRYKYSGVNWRVAASTKTITYLTAIYYDMSDKLIWGDREWSSYSDGYIAGIQKIEKVSELSPEMSGVFVGTTNTDTRIMVTGFDAVNSIVPLETNTDNTSIYYVVSFDQQTTFKIWDATNTEWREIAKNDAGTWKYNDSETATPNWVDATTTATATAYTNNKYTALRLAFAVTDNQMTGAQLSALTKNELNCATGYMPGQCFYIDLGFGLSPSGQETPFLSGFNINVYNLGSTTVEVLTSSGWTSGLGWVDNTESGGASLGQSGTIEYDSTSPCEADYAVVSGVPGYWYRFKTNGTSPDTSITRITYKAPCQPLSNIGDGQAEKPIGFVCYDSAAGSSTDFTPHVIDNTKTDLSCVNLPMNSSDYVYIGGESPFSAIAVSMYYPNKNASTVQVEYWNGAVWTSMALVTDYTRSNSDKTLNADGIIQWSAPDDWRQNIPFNAFMSRGYWVRLSVSASLSTDTSVYEVRIYPVPGGLPKYRHVEVFGNRIALANRPDAADRVDLSRELEEYGFSGGTSSSARIGGQDAIQCLLSAWNSLWVGKTDSWYRFTQTQGQFGEEFIEAARHIPISSRVVVKAPYLGTNDDGSKYALFFINRYGAFVSTGLQADSLFSTARNKVLSIAVDWWQEKASTYPRLDLNYLHKAVGEYWPAKNWVIWSVPMIVTEGQTSQTTNNRLIVFDLTLGAWLPPFTIAAASLTTAFSYNASTVGKLGSLMLYAGDYQGRIHRLFAPGQTTDNGTAIASWAETGWLHFGAAEIEKQLREVWLWGNSISGATLNTSSRLWRRQHTIVTTTSSKTFSTDLDPDNGLVGLAFEGGESELANFFKFTLLLGAFSEIYGLQFGYIPEREIGGT